MKLLRVNAMCVPPCTCLRPCQSGNKVASLVSMRLALRCIGLLERLRSVEGVDFHALVKNTHDGRHRRGLGVEIACSEHLAREADIGQRWCVAMAEPARLALLRQMRF